MIIKVITILLAIHFGQCIFCQFMKTKDEVIIKPNAATQQRQAKTENLIQTALKSDVFRMYQSNIEEPPKTDHKLIDLKNLDIKSEIGKGAFGKVWDVTIGQKDRAVKQISLSRVLLKGLLKDYPLTSPENKMCLSSIDELISSRELFADTLSAKKGEFSQDYISSIQGLKTSSLRIPNLPECKGIEGFYDKIWKRVESALSNIRREIVVIKALHEYSVLHEEPNRSFPIYEHCLVDSQFSVFIVMERLGKSFQEIPKIDNGSFTKDLKDRLWIYMSLMNQVLILHGGNYVHCDIKPGNILFSLENIHQAHLIDLGLSSFMKICVGRTDGYAPPEVYFPGIDSQQKDFEFNTPEFHKHDVFSLAITILEMETDAKSFEEVHNFVKGFANLTNDSELPEKDKEFRILIEKKQSALLTKIYGADYATTKNATGQILMQFYSVLFSALRLQYIARISLRPLLFLTYKLYRKSVDLNTHFTQIKTYIDDVELLKEESDKPEWMIEMMIALKVKGEKKLKV